MSAWKACDIRGVYPAEVNPEMFRQVGRSVPILLPPTARVVVAGDYRVSTPGLKAALAQGLVEAGASVIDAGQAPTPIIYFAHHHWGTDAILIVTASHNPAQHNGLKLMLGYLPPTEEDLRRLRSKVEKDGFSGSDAAGTLECRDPVPLYLEWIEERWRHLKLRRKLRLVLDPGNGAWAELAPPVFERLGFAVDCLFCEIDGNFPNRPPDCARSANLVKLRTAVRANKADMGIAWDGDGDRVAFVDHHGKFVSADEISMLLARKLLAGRTGEKVAYDLKLSAVFRKVVLEMGGIPLTERSGHTFLKRRVIGDHCLLGCEISGHYFFRELHGGDDGMFAALQLLELLQEGRSLAELRQELPGMHMTPDLRLPLQADEYDSIILRIRQAVHPDEETAIDGVRMQTEDGFVLVRRSVTEPVITMRIEGLTALSLQKLVDRCASALPEFTEAIFAQILQEGTR
ncbi:MAG: phosphomannomutase/phosphoglucomutase [Bryobacteraceae bacterium]